MKHISTVILGLSLMASSALYAANDAHEGHNMTMSSHTMDKANMGAFHKQMMTDGYQVLLNSEKPLISGINNMSIILEKDGKIVTDAKVKVKFFMPEMPGMPYMESISDATLDGDTFKYDAILGMSGTWQYQLKFKTSDGKIHKTRGSVNN